MGIFIKGGGGKGGGLESIVAGTGISVDVTDPDNPIVSSTVTDTNDAAKVSSNDTTAGYLNGKLVAGTGITLTENNNGGNETLTIATTVTNTDETAKVSSNDTTAGYLNGKLVAGSNITLTENNNGGNETLTIAAAGGVTGFTGSQNTASPNNTVNASRLLVDATSTNADAVIQPKGTGALLASLPDGTATGGNKRGANSVDLQTVRSAASHVASGIESVSIGRQNTASGDRSFVCGFGNIASGTDSFASGQGTIASGQQSFAANIGTTAGGHESAAFNRGRTTSDSWRSFSHGHGEADKYLQYVHGGNPFGTVGDCQYERHIVGITTTNATPAILDHENVGSVVSRRIISIKPDATYTFSALVTARRTDADNESAGYKIEGVIDNNAGTTEFVGTPVVTVLGEDTAAWDVVVEADNTNDRLAIKVTGETGKTIRWAAAVELMKVAG